MKLSSKLKNNSEIKNIFLKSYIKMFKYEEGEVRSMACKQLNVASEFLGKEESFYKVFSYLIIRIINPML